MGKGDNRRPTNEPRYRANYDRIFGEQQAPAHDAPWDDEACDRELLANDDNFCLDCMGHVCTCEEEDGER